jgi:hypothetical protein
VRRRWHLAERGLDGQLWLHHQVPAGPSRVDNAPLAPISPAPAAGQLAFDLPGLVRDWSPVVPGQLPQLADLASALDQALRDHAHAHRWDRNALSGVRRLLRIAVFHYGLETRFPEAELRAMAASHLENGARRAFAFLIERGMFEPIPASPGRDERWVRTRLAELPDSIREDVGSWIEALRGHGRRPSPPVTWATVRVYLQFAGPALNEWAACYGTLRAVVRQDIEDAIRGHPGSSPHNVHTALRSLFRGLKRERRIFADPAQDVTAHFIRKLPRPVPLERLRGLLDQSTIPATGSSPRWWRCTPSASKSCAHFA